MRVSCEFCWSLFACNPANLILCLFGVFSEVKGMIEKMSWKNQIFQIVILSPPPPHFRVLVLQIKFVAIFAKNNFEHIFSPTSLRKMILESLSISKNDFFCPQELLVAQADRRAKKSPSKTKYWGSLLKTTTMESEKQKDLRVFFSYKTNHNGLPSKYLPIWKLL